MVDFKSLATPQVRFTAALTHSRTPPHKMYCRWAPAITKMPHAVDDKYMWRTAWRALEKVLKNRHSPSSDAGQEEYMSVVMGNFCIEPGAFHKVVDEALTQASEDTIKATIHVPVPQGRNFAVMFAEQEKWSTSRDDEIDQKTMDELQYTIDYIDSYPMFFKMKYEGLTGPASSRAPAPQLQPPTRWRSSPRAELSQERERMMQLMQETNALKSLPAAPPIVLRSVDMMSPAPTRTNPD